VVGASRMSHNQGEGILSYLSDLRILISVYELLRCLRSLVGADMIPALEEVAANDLAPEVNAIIFLHFDVYFRRCMSSNEFKPPAGSSRYHPFPPLLEPRPLHGVAVSG